MNRKLVFLFASLLIALLDALFVVANYHLSRQSMLEDMQAESATLFSAFQAAQRDTESNLLLIASVFSNDDRVQTLFRRARDAIAAEGGGPGKAQSAAVRRELYDYVGPRWQQAMEHLGARQLHFHLGPGSLSFLRVHRPAKFGDRMDDVRFTIVDTNAQRTPRSGFETGRVYSGIRGVVPVFARPADGGEPEHVGALEAGVSFENLVGNFRDATGSNVTILLTREHIEASMWPESIKKRFEGQHLPGGYVMESSSSPIIDDLFQDLPRLGAATRPGEVHAGLRAIQARYYHLALFPLYDYLSAENPNRPPSGLIGLWKDVTPRIHGFQRNQWFNLVYAVLAFLIVELILYLAFRHITGFLEGLVAARTADLTASQERLRTLIDASPDLICLKDGDGRWTEANEAGLELLGLQGRRYQGKTSRELADMAHPWLSDALRKWQDADQRAWLRGEVERFQDVLPAQNGPGRTFDFIKVPIFDSLADRRALVVLGRDISELRRANHALEESESRYRRFFTHNRAPMLLLDPVEGWIVDANQAACDFYGYGSGELKQLNFSDIDTLPEENIHAELARAQRQERDHFKLRHQLKDGRIRDVEMYAGPIELDNRELLYAIVHDVSERRRAEERLEQQREFLQAVVDGIPDPVLVIEPNFRVALMNRTARENLSEDLHNNPCLKCHQVNRHLDRLCSGKDQECPLTRALQIREAMRVEHRQADKNGKVRHYEIWVVPFWDRSGSFRGVVETSREILHDADAAASP